jgi:hypothetical protein
LFTIFPTGKISPSHSSRLSPMSNIGGKLTGRKVPQRNMEYMESIPLGIIFVDAVKEQYYPVDNYKDKYMRWTTLWQEKSQTMSKFKNTFHTLHTKLGIKDSRLHLILKYHGALYRYIKTEMDFLNISSLVFSYRYAIKIKHKFRHRNKWKFRSTNPQQTKHGKDDPNQQPPENQSMKHEKKGKGKMKNDTGNW